MTDLRLCQKTSFCSNGVEAIKCAQKALYSALENIAPDSEAVEIRPITMMLLDF